MFSRKLSNFLNLLAGLISIVQLLRKTVVHFLIQAYMIIAEYLHFGTNIFESSTDYASKIQRKLPIADIAIFLARARIKSSRKPFKCLFYKKIFYKQISSKNYIFHACADFKFFVSKINIQQQKQANLENKLSNT